MKKLWIVILMCVVLTLHPDEAFAAKKQKKNNYKRVTTEKIVEGGFEATGKVVDGAFRATDNILLAALSIPLLPLFLLNEALEAPSRADNHSLSYNNRKQSYRSEYRRSAKAGDRVWKEY